MASRRAAVLVDLSGTLHVEDSAIPRACEALIRLRAIRPVKFVTNTTKESIRLLHNRLQKCGFHIEKNEIFTSLIAARQLVEEKKARPMLLLEPDALEDFYGLDISNPNSVVVGLAPSHFCFKRLNEAFKLLLEGADLIAVHKAKYYKRKDGLALGPGPFVTGLEYATGKQAVVVGKPEKEFFRLGVSSIGDDIDIENTVMIGDDVTDDIIGAINAGMKAILVRTGKYRKGDECCIPIERRNCVDSFVDAVDLIESGCIL